MRHRALNPDVVVLLGPCFRICLHHLHFLSVILLEQLTQPRSQRCDLTKTLVLLPPEEVRSVLKQPWNHSGRFGVEGLPENV